MNKDYATTKAKGEARVILRRTVGKVALLTFCIVDMFDIPGFWFLRAGGN